MQTSSEVFSAGTPVNSLELAELGIDPGFFLFTGNSMYDYDGIYLVDIVAANVDPAGGTTSLTGVATQEVVLNLGSGGSGDAISSSNMSPFVPEPSTWALLAGGFSVVVLCWLVSEQRTGA